MMQPTVMLRTVDAHSGVPGKEYGNHLGPGINDAGGRHAHQNKQRGNSHQGTRRSIIALFQEFRNGVHTAFQQFGKEAESHDHQRNGGQPFIPGNRHAHPVGGLAGHAHELFRGNVGGNQRKADEPPGQAAAGQEIVGSTLRLLLFLRLLRITALPDTQGNDAHDHHAEQNDFRHGKRCRRHRFLGFLSLLGGVFHSHGRGWLDFSGWLHFRSRRQSRSGQRGLGVRSCCRNGPLLGGGAPRHQGHSPEYGC